MLKFLKLAMVMWLLFVGASIALGGGEKLREISESTGSVIEKIIDMAADKADSLNEDVIAVKEKIDRWTGVKKEPAEKKV